MIIEIDFNSDEAIYIQLRNQIIMGIATSTIHEGDSLPSVRQLADNIGINMHTVNKAYNVLRQEGFLQFWYTDDRAAETAGRLPLADSHAKQFMIIDPRIHSGDRIALTVDLDADSQLIVICVDPEGNAEKLGNADLSNGRFMQE